MQLTRLSELKPGEEAIVVRVEGGGPLTRRLADMGLVVGAKVRVVRVAPLGDPMELEIRGYNLSLRREEARLVLVEVISSGAR